MELSFGRVEYLHLLWAVPVLALVYGFGFSRKGRALRRFASAGLLGRLMPGVSLGRQVFKSVVLLAAVAVLVFALAGPRWGEREVEVYQPGVDVMVVLDASRSMLAEDCRPNRLEKAKQYINDLLEVLPGDRVGLVTFSGTAVLSCPLTPNYGWFRMALDEVDPRLVPRGGSNLAEAIRLAARKLGDRPGDHKAILLITDGEDHESDPQFAAAYAFEDHGVRTFAIGLGDAATGRRVPMAADDDDGGPTQFARNEDGSEHYSRMDATVLEAIARAGGEGFAVPAGTAEIRMAEFYERMRSRLDPQEFAVRRQERVIERYQWFAAVALVLLMAETLLTDRRPGGVPKVRSEK
ncbi:MAG: VWA domain-containing protein [Planctomycetes bacterium]|nr:VWA domain-containing protein [Planctomycetota bacterium]